MEELNLICRTCKKEKPSTAFYKCKTKRGFFLDCKECWLEYKRVHYRETFDLVNEYHKRRYQDNKQRISEAHKEYYRRTILVRRAKAKEKRENWNKRVHEFYSGHCYMCGFDDLCYAVYDCHHVDPDQKEREVSTLVGLDWDTTVVPELDKCIYVCSNCHRKLHNGFFDEDLRSGRLILIPGGKK